MGTDLRQPATTLAADEIKAARVRSGLTQVQLAQKIGTSQKGITRLESGRHNMTLGTLERVAKATNSVLDLRIRPRKRA